MLEELQLRHTEFFQVVTSTGAPYYCRNGDSDSVSESDGETSASAYGRPDPGVAGWAAGTAAAAAAARAVGLGATGWAAGGPASGDSLGALGRDG